MIFKAPHCVGFKVGEQSQSLSHSQPFSACEVKHPSDLDKVRQRAKKLPGMPGGSPWKERDQAHKKLWMYTMATVYAIVLFEDSAVAIQMGKNMFSPDENQAF